MLLGVGDEQKDNNRVVEKSVMDAEEEGVEAS
jgi:hypothetical protein